jgi:hypothetical protein
MSFARCSKMSSADVSSAVCRIPTALVGVLRSPCVLLAAGVLDLRAFYKTLRLSFPLFEFSKPNSNMAVCVDAPCFARPPLLRASLGASLLRARLVIPGPRSASCDTGVPQCRSPNPPLRAPKVTRECDGWVLSTPTCPPVRRLLSALPKGRRLCVLLPKVLVARLVLVGSSRRRSVVTSRSTHDRVRLVWGEWVSQHDSRAQLCETR